MCDLVSVLFSKLPTELIILCISFIKTIVIRNGKIMIRLETNDKKYKSLQKIKNPFIKT